MPQKSFVSIALIWIIGSSAAIALVLPSYMLWQIACVICFAGYVIGKWTLLSKAKSDLFKSPNMYLALQGFYFLLALIFVAVIMLLFKENKKQLLPLVLGNYLFFLILDTLHAIRKKPLK